MKKQNFKNLTGNLLSTYNDNKNNKWLIEGILYGTVFDDIMFILTSMKDGKAEVEEPFVHLIETTIEKIIYGDYELQNIKNPIFKMEAVIKTLRTPKVKKNFKNVLNDIFGGMV